MGDWWGEKLRGNQPAPQRQSFGAPIVQSQQFYPQQPQPQPGPPQPAPGPESYVPPEPGDPYGYHKTMWQWQGNPNGGAGETQKVGNCPSCGSSRFFSRQSPETGITTANGTVYPSPECAECGYPRQQGALGVSAKAVGNAIPARQGESLSPPGSLASLRT